MAWIEYIKGIDAAASLLILAITTIGGAVIWYVRSRKGISSEISKVAARAVQAPAQRMQQLEARVSAVETRMGDAATRGDVADLRSEIHEMQIGLTRIEGGQNVQAENSRALSDRIGALANQINMFTEAKLREGRQE